MTLFLEPEKETTNSNTLAIGGCRRRVGECSFNLYFCICQFEICPNEMEKITLRKSGLGKPALTLSNRGLMFHR